MPTPEPAERDDRDEEPAGVYVHIPFCTRICPYCDFAVTVADAGARRRLIEAVRLEAGRAAPALARSVDTIYFGGGTPSLLEPRELGRILESLTSHFELEPHWRVFLEVNPEDVEAERSKAWRQLGVTTISLGVQALDDAALEFLGRRHSARQARRAVEIALATGFETVSIDLIYARPNQDVGRWRAELDAAVGLGIDHLSCYQLTVEPGTPFGRRAARGELQSPPEDLQADLFFATHQHLAERGFDGYEVSNFARAPEHRSRHNRKYWRRVPYLGLGPAAHSFAGGRRWWNVRSSRRYVELVESGESPIEASEELTPRQHALERLLLGLRCREGVELRAVADSADRKLRRWEELGWIEIEGDRLLPTLDGMALAERLAAELELAVDSLHRTVAS